MDKSWYKPKLETPWNIISLGAGVQSSTMALMAAKGEITPMPQAAVFADTQAEPESVYKWLRWLTTELAPHFPVYTVSRGCLTTESLTVRQRVKPVEGRPDKGHWVKSFIPAFILNPDGSRGILGRQCTFDYKLEEITKFVRKFCEIKRGQKDITVTQWLGISNDEKQRMKAAMPKWQQNRWPLVELGMNRADCLRWMERNGYPIPPRSACIYCPFHSDHEWVRLRDEDPEAFQKAVWFERELTRVHSLTDNRAGVPFLHSSLVPLDQVKFKNADKTHPLFGDYSTEGMLNECEGMCGV